ncbi:MAG TPA: hypothetical protein VMA72_25725 [Streptosporangiaceae bacterium]|nr:hypothetical protein [Streptosporangiaceae bacterium]
MDAYSRELMPVIDPALAPGTRRWLTRLLARRANPADKLVIEYLGPVGLVACILGALVTGLAVPWLGAGAVCVLASLAVNHEVVTGALLRHRQHFVSPAELNGACWQPLHSVQRAIDAVLTSQVYQAGLLADAAQAEDLKWHEWQVACSLRDITRLGAEHTDSMTARPGPQTAAVLTAHTRALAIAQDATTRRIGELRRYASEVRAADSAMHDWRTAEQVARRNDRYLELFERSEADEQAVAAITVMARQVMRNRDAFEATLGHAAQAGQLLVLRSGRSPRALTPWQIPRARTDRRRSAAGRARRRRARAASTAR